MTKKHVVLGLDQSYEETGFAFGVDGKIVNAGSFKYHCNRNPITKINARKRLYNDVSRCIDKAYDNGYNSIDIYIEKVRNEGRTTFDFLKMAGAMESTIQHAVYDQFLVLSSRIKIRLYAVSTISWKSKIVGSVKKQNNDLKLDPSKYQTMMKCVELGYENYLFKPVDTKTRNGIIKIEQGQKYTYNDNIADAICICLYGFLPLEIQKREDLLQ